MDVEWRKYVREDKSTWPPDGKNVWVMERFYGDGTPDIGVHDGYHFEVDGSDDCSVSHWAPIEYPAAPAGWSPEDEAD